MGNWHIITGEYPPQPGGVSDYTCLLAQTLAATGDRVEVWAPASAGDARPLPGVTVRRLPGNFGPRALSRLEDALSGRADDARLLVQYVPHMYGWKAMNLAFCSWLLLRCPVRPWVMFHEVAYPYIRGQRLRHNLLGAVNHLMAGMVARAAERIFVSIAAWKTLLRRLAPGRRPMQWLPIPSNIPTRADEAAVRAVRVELGGAGLLVIGHFGTFGGAVEKSLAAALPPLLLADACRVGLLVGRGSTAFAERLRANHPTLAGRLHARGEAAGEVAAANLKACDLLLQPYPDGVSARRGSLMAGLALGVPLLTTHGNLTEPVWAEEALVALAPAGDTDALVAAAERLLADPVARDGLAARGAAGYARRFSIDHTVRVLREAARDGRRTPPVATCFG
jgi:glycosyltransferase involved in cell wall biosynthesis